jgi:hypothetical protein
MNLNHLNRDALVVGICQYDDLHMSQQLDSLTEQAEALAKLLETQGGFKVTRLPCATDLTLDLKRRVTLPDLEQAITKLLYPPKESPTQTALLFFAGHGLVKPSPLGTEGFLATSEADGKSVYGFSLKTLRELLHHSPVKQQIIFLEACHSGTLFADFQVDNEHDYCWVTSTRAHEEALAEGLLVKALLESLDGKKRLENHITSKMLINYLRNIEEHNKGWQRFGYEIHGESIILSGVNREVLSGTQLKSFTDSTAKSATLGRAQPSRVQLTRDQKAKLVNALLNCPTIQDLESRLTVLRQLPAKITNNIRNVPQSKLHVTNIVDTCLNYAEGLTELVEVLRGFEEDSQPMQTLDKVLKEIYHR